MKIEKIEEALDCMCDYCKEFAVAPDEVVVVNGLLAHRTCAERAGDVQAFMEAPEWTWEQKQYWAADCQTAEHLYNTKQYEEVVVHVGGMYGLSRAEVLERQDNRTWQERADWCMTQL